MLGYTLAFVANPGQPTFKAMAEAVSQLPADGGKVNTWPIVTLLPFLADPKKFMPLKPTNTELIAARMAFDLKYDSTPNWETYDQTLRMAAQLLDAAGAARREGHDRCAAVYGGDKRPELKRRTERLTGAWVQLPGLVLWVSGSNTELQTCPGPESGT